VRDLRHLEELSSATAFGSWANDVVVALDRARLGDQFGDGDVEVLGEAAVLLRGLDDRNLRRQASGVARSLTAGQTTRTAFASVIGRDEGRDQKAILERLASTVEKAAKRAIPTGDNASVDALIHLFERIGDLQLVKSNSIWSARKRAAWTATGPT